MFDISNKIYIKIDDVWFDVTNYNDHPGGKQIFKKFHLKDATNEFNSMKGHSDSYVLDLLTQFEVKNVILIMYLNLIKI
jgi:cytochrome b involved in lipid metabolism